MAAEMEDRDQAAHEVKEISFINKGILSHTNEEQQI